MNTLVEMPINPDDVNLYARLLQRLQAFDYVHWRQLFGDFLPLDGWNQWGAHNDVLAFGLKIMKGEDVSESVERFNRILDELDHIESVYSEQNQ